MRINKTKNTFSNFFKGSTYSYRAFDVRIKSIDAPIRRIVIDKNSFKGPQKIKLSFTVDLNAVISTKDNKLILLSDIRLKEKINLYFTVNEKRFQLVKGITVLR